MRRWLDIPSLNDHIRKHLQNSREDKIRCLHPSCTCHGAMDKVDLIDHFRGMHGIQLRKGFMDND
jgi:hypothetical protein